MKAKIFISLENMRLLVRCLLVNCGPGNGTNYRYLMVIMLITAIFSSCWDSPNIKCQHTASSPASWLELIQRRYLEQHIGSPDFLSTINGGVIKPVIEYQAYLDSRLLQCYLPGQRLVSLEN